MESNNINNRTKGEWFLDTRASGNVRSKEGRGICNTMGYTTNADNGEHIEENKANAAYIVEACNNYDALIEALRKSINNINQLCEMVNFFSNKLSLGNKVKNEDFTEVAKQLLNSIKQ